MKLNKLLLLPFCLTAITTLANEPLVIKVISGQEVLGKLEEGKEIEGRLLKKRQKWEGEIGKIENEMKRLAEQFEVKRKTARPEVLEADQQKLLKLRRDHQNTAKDAEEDMKRGFNKELGKLNQKIQTTVSKVAQKNNWDIVSLKETGEVIYVSSRADATNEIITMINREYAATPKKK